SRARTAARRPSRGRAGGRGSCGLQPMLVDFHLDQVPVGPLVTPPYFTLVELHTVKHALGLAVEAVGELLRVGKTAANALDLANLPADVGGRAPVARRVGVLYAHAVADVEAPLGRRRIGTDARPRSHSACEPASFFLPARPG